MNYLVCGLVLGASLMAHTTHAAESRPNIILVMADDQGWGDMAYQGDPHAKTPHFDALAKEGLRFDRFYAAAPVCSPTRGSVLTGRHPNRFGCFKWGNSLRPQEVTLAEVLKKSGYATGHFGKWHLGSVRAGSPVNPGNSGFDKWLSGENFFDNNPILSREGQAVQLQGESSMVTVDAAIEFIDDCVKQNEPFFAVVWFGSPHNPHQAAKKYRDLYPGLPAAKANFLGEISGMDAAFGKLRETIRTLGIRDNTLLWYCSDNGALPVGSSGGHRGKKGQVYEGGLLVPALLEWPAKIKSPRTTNFRANTVDIYPTLLEIVSAKVDEQPLLDGVSLVPLLDGKVETRPQPLGFWDFPEGGLSTPNAQWMKELLDAQAAGKDDGGDAEKLRLDAGKISKQYPANTTARGHAAWIDGDWKLHRMPDKQSGDKASRYELYNLAEDRAEKHNVIDAQPERAATMRAALEKWQASVLDSLNGKDYPSE